MPIIERTPPMSAEAERCVLGSMVLSRDAIWTVAGILAPSDFRYLGYNEIFETIISLSERGDAVDDLTLSEELKRVGKLDQVGGMETIIGLWDTVPTPVHAEYYAKIVLEKSIRRRAIETAVQYNGLLYDEETDSEETVSRFVADLSSIFTDRAGGDMRSAQMLADGLLSDIETAQQQGNAIRGLPTGMEAVDRLLRGLSPKNVYMLAARPQLGKSALMLQIAEHNASAGVPVVVFSAEMSAEQLAQRSMARLSGLPIERLTSGAMDDKDWSKTAAASAQYSSLPLYICDRSCSQVDKLCAKARRYVGEKKAKLICIDYAQLLYANPKQTNRVQDLSDVSRKLLELASDLDVPVLLLSQLSRDIEKRSERKPQLSDLRDCGSLEQDAFAVIFIWRPDGPQEGVDNPTCQLLVAKNRQGRSGFVNCRYNGPSFTFGVAERRHEDPVTSHPGGDDVDWGD